LFFIIGGAVVTIQGLSHFGYRSVDYNKINKDINRLLDFNSDGEADDMDIITLFDKVRYSNQII
jgi:hypothetical protein